MLNFNTLILTLTLGFFSLLLNETQGDLAFNKQNRNTYNFQNDRNFNACALSTNNSFELISFEKQRKQPTTNYFCIKVPSFNETSLDIDFQYLKTCRCLNLSLATNVIIYPFHSFW